MLLRSFVRSLSVFHAANTDTHTTITVTDVVLLWIAPSGQRQAWTVDRSRPTLNAPGTQTKSAEATTTPTPTPTYAGGETTTTPTTTDRPGQLSADGDPGDDVSLLPRMLDDDRGAHHGAGPHGQEVSE